MKKAKIRAAPRLSLCGKVDADGGRRFTKTGTNDKGRMALRLSKFEIFSPRLARQNSLPSADFQRRIAAGKFSVRPGWQRRCKLTADGLQEPCRPAAAPACACLRLQAGRQAGPCSPARQRTRLTAGQGRGPKTGNTTLTVPFTKKRKLVHRDFIPVAPHGPSTTPHFTRISLQSDFDGALNCALRLSGGL